MNPSFQLLRRVLRKGKPYIPVFLLLGGVGLVKVPLELYALLLSRKLIDQGFLQQSWDTIKQTLLFFILVFILRSLISYGTNLISTGVQLRMNKDFQSELFSHIIHLPMRFFTKEPTGQLMSRVLDDANRFSTIFNQLFSRAIFDPLKLLVLFSLIAYFNLHLCTLMVISALISFLVIRWTGRKFHLYSKKIQKKTAALYSFVQQILSNMELIKAKTTEKSTAANFHDRTDQLVQLMLKPLRTSLFEQPLLEFFAYLALGTVFIYGSWMISKDLLTLGTLTAFLGATYLFFNTLNSLGRTYGLLRETLARMEILFSILDSPPESSADSSCQCHKIPSPISSVEFDHVSFGYTPSTPALKYVSFQVPHGCTFGIMGQSGSGKTTLVRLLSRFYEPDEGEIKLNGQSIHHFDLTSLRSSIGIVFQENLILNDTIKNNIAYGMDQISMEKIIEAAEISLSHDFIQSLPHQYETIVGEAGRCLSGGERQRLSIARAMIADPEILILDEGTSFLEVEQETAILQKIREARKGRITIIISHRLSAMRTADKILTLDNGRLLEIECEALEGIGKDRWKGLYDRIGTHH